MNQQNLNSLVEMLKRHEGFRSELYKCPTGHLTIGYGHNCDAHGDIVKFQNRTVSIDEATNILLNDMAEARLDCLKFIRSFENVSEVQQAILIDMAFNMGIAKLTKFKDTLKAFSLDNRKGIAKGMIDSDWCSQVGKRATELVYMALTNEFI